MRWLIWAEINSETINLKFQIRISIPSKLINIMCEEIFNRKLSLFQYVDTMVPLYITWKNHSSFDYFLVK